MQNPDFSSWGFVLFEEYCFGKVYKNKKPPAVDAGGFKKGDDLLSHGCSTIGANGLNFSVRKGKR